MVRDLQLLWKHHYMRTDDVQCPHCKGKHISTAQKTIQIIFGLGMAIIGAGFLITALTYAEGYYLFALPLCTVGLISFYKGRTDHQVQGHCKDCKHEFEYITD